MEKILINGKSIKDFISEKEVEVRSDTQVRKLTTDDYNNLFIK